MALGRGSISNIDGSTIQRPEMLPLPVVVANEQYSGEELNRFLASVRKLLDSSTTGFTGLGKDAGQSAQRWRQAVVRLCV